MRIGNLEVYGIIYKITNKVNGKVYIGQTTQTGGFRARYYGSIINTTNGHLKASINKYGVENFNISEVYDIAFSKEELDIKETIYIQLYRSYEPQYGYNKELGGASGLPTIEVRKKMSKAQRGRLITNEHRKKISKSQKITLSRPEVKKKKSEAMKGVNNPNYGKKFNEEHKRKISEALRGKKHSEETRKKLKEKARKGVNNPVARAVICLNTGTKFNTTTEASKWAGLTAGASISGVCNGKRKTAGKHPITAEPLRWAYCV